MSNKKTILLVEDEALIAMVQKKTLERYGYKVIAVHSGEKAMEKVRTTPDIYLILMDIDLGKGMMDGTEAAEAILKDHDIPVVFLSSHTEKDVVEKTERITSYGYVVKGSGETVLDASIKMAFKLHGAHRELKETKEAADRYLNVAAELILSLDSRGSITLLNDSGCRLLGYDRAELMGKNWFDTCLPERLREEVKEVFGKLVQGSGEDALAYENPVLTKSGEELIILWHNTMLRDENGEIVTILSSGEDITSRKRAETALKKESVRRHTLFEQSPDGILIIDPQTARFLDFNTAAHRQLGYSREEFAALSIFDIDAVETAGETTERIAGVIRDGRADFETVQRTKQGELRNVHVTAQILDVEGQKVYHCIWRDITERKQVEAALRESGETLKKKERYLGDVVDFFPDAVIAIDKEKRITIWNQATEKMTGIPASEMVGKGDYAYAVPFYGVPRPVLMNLLWETEQEIAGKYQLVGREGGNLVAQAFCPALFGGKGAHIWAKASPIFDDEGRLAGAIESIRDVTDRKVAEEEITREREKLKALFDTAPFGMILIDRDGHFTYINQKFTDLFGYDISEIPDGRTWFRKAYPDAEYRHTLISSWKHDYRDAGPGEQRPRTFTVTCKNGSRKVVNFIPVALAFGGHLMTCEDITGRRQAEDKLEQQVAAMEASMDGIAILNEDHDYVYLNEAHARAYGYATPEELKGKSWRVLYDENELQRFNNDIMPEFTRKGRWRGEATGKRKDGSTFPQEISLTVLDTGGLACVVRDITDRRQTMDALRWNTALLEAQLNTSIDGILVVDENQRRLITNQRLIDMWNVPQHISEDKDDTALLNYVVSLVKYPEQFLEKVMYLYQHPYEISRDEIEFKNGMFLDRYSAPVLDKDGQHYGRVWTFRDITEQTEAVERLRESETTFRIHVENAFDIIFTLDKEGTFVFLSPAWERHFGYPVSEAVGKRFDPFVHPDDVAPCVEYLMRVLNTGLSETSPPFRVKHSDGDWRLFVANGMRYIDTKGERTFIGVGRDVTAQIQAQETLKESEANFRTFFETMSDMVVVGTPDGRLLFANTAVTRKLGYSAEETAAMHVLDLYPGEKRQEAGEILFSMLRGERNNCPLAVARKDGSLIPVDTRIWFGQWNGADCIFGISKDLSAQQEAEQRFERLFRNNPALMALSTLPERLFSDVNDTFLKVLGYSRGDIIGKTAPELGLFVHPEDQEAVADALLANGRIVDVELQVRCKDGAILDGLFSGEVISSQGRQVLLTLMHDITDRKRAENQVKTSLKEKELLLKEVHHRVKNNLMVVSSILSLQSGTLKDRKAREVLEDCRKRIQVMSLIHNRLYRSTDLASIHFREYAGDLLSDILRSHGTHAGDVTLSKDIEDISFDIDTAVPLGLVMNELVSNALKHAFPDGKKGTVTVNLHVQGGNVLLTVRDDGKGFPGDVDFTSTESLGMQLVVSLAEQLDGIIELKRDNGTEFTITFPHGNDPPE